MFIVDIPVWMTIFKDWFECCHFYIKRLQQKKVVYRTRSVSVNDISWRKNEEKIYGLNLI